VRILVLLAHRSLGQFHVLLDHRLACVGFSTAGALAGTDEVLRPRFEPALPAARRLDEQPRDRKRQQ
jgi:hypothetical protein